MNARTLERAVANVVTNLYDFLYSAAMDDDENGGAGRAGPPRPAATNSRNEISYPM